MQVAPQHAERQRTAAGEHVEERFLLDGIHGHPGGVPPRDGDRVPNSPAHQTHAARPVGQLAAVGTCDADELAGGVGDRELGTRGGEPIQPRLHEAIVAPRLDAGKGQGQNPARQRREAMGPNERDVVETRHAPGGVKGTITVPPSKSLTQRALVAAAVAAPGSRIIGPLDAEDPRLLFDALRQAGFRLAWADGAVTAEGRTPVDGASLHMGNNGTGARLLIAQLAGLPGVWEVDGSSRLRERPIGALVGALRALGASIDSRPGTEPRLPLRIRGQELAGAEAAVDASDSSQFVSALLLLGATLRQGLVVRLPAPPPSRPYVRLTTHVLEAFGALAVESEGGTLWSVRGGGLAPAELTVEGDWSAAAFPMAAAALSGGEVEVAGVRLDSPQGDAAVLGILARAGCTVRDSARGVVLAGPARSALSAELRDTPDLFPALAVVVAAVGGTLTGLGGLAAKESDRLAVMAERLTRMGFAVAAGPDWFSSRGGIPRESASGEAFDPAGDHRVAMALAVAGCGVAGVRVADPGCVGKSWPRFWEAWSGIVP